MTTKNRKKKGKKSHSTPERKRRLIIATEELHTSMITYMGEIQMSHAGCDDFAGTAANAAKSLLIGTAKMACRDWDQSRQDSIKDMIEEISGDEDDEAIDW